MTLRCTGFAYNSSKVVDPVQFRVGLLSHNGENMKQVYKDRLLKLATFLENVPRRKFNLSWFIDTKYDVLPSQDYLKEGFCGTTACAVGYCPVVFPRLFSYKKDRNRVGTDNYEIVLSRNQDIKGFTAAQEVFGISLDDLLYMFDPDSYNHRQRGPKSVARRIRTFVKCDGKVPHNTKAYNNSF